MHPSSRIWARMARLFIKEALIESFCCHAGESRHPESSLKPLDSGFRRNDKTERVHLFRASLRHSRGKTAREALNNSPLPLKGGEGKGEGVGQDNDLFRPLPSGRGDRFVLRLVQSFPGDGVLAKGGRRHTAANLYAICICPAPILSVMETGFARRPGQSGHMRSSASRLYSTLDNGGGNDAEQDRYRKSAGRRGAGEKSCSPVIVPPPAACRPRT